MYAYPSASSSSLDFVFYTADITPSSFVLPVEDSTPWQSDIYEVFKTWWALRELQHLCLFSFLFLMINPSINSADIFALMEPYTYHLFIYIRLIWPLLHPTIVALQVLHFPQLLLYPSSIFIHPKTSRRILSFPWIHHLLAFFPNSRCLFDR